MILAWLLACGGKAEVQLDPGTQAVIDCNDGDAAACLTAGEALVQWGDAKGAVNTLSRACAAKVPRACARLGDVALTVKPPDVVQARVGFEGACAVEDWNACNSLGALLHEQLGRPADARPIYERACSSGYVLSCANLGILYRDGEGVAADQARANTYFEDACGRGSVGACYDLANQAASGRAPTINDERQFDLFAGACRDTQPFPIGCANALVLVDAGRVQRPLESLVALGERGCDLRDGPSCFLLGRIQARLGLPNEPAMKRACELGETRACPTEAAHP